MIHTTSFAVFIKKHHTAIVLLFGAACVFLAGWHMGRVTSPYYTTTPIVFQDRECSACSPSTISNEELVHMASGAAPAVLAGENVQGSFVASVNSNLFHHIDCSHASRINPENQVWFSSTQEAHEAGYAPSQCTQDMLR